MTTLELSWNQIGDTGATALAEGLKHNGALQTLILGGNQIGNDGAIAIGTALESNRNNPLPAHVPLTTCCS